MATGTVLPEPEGPCDLPRISGAGIRPRYWSMTRDADGHRHYSVTYRVDVDRAIHGPLAALYTPGLPEPGTYYYDGYLLDTWAFYTGEAEVVPVHNDGGNNTFDITLKATTKPTYECATVGRTDPLLYPDRVEIETINYSKEAIYDRFDFLILNSAWEQVRGPQVEFDAHRVRVIIEQNVQTFDLELVNNLMHCLNDAPMWGFEARQVKLSGASGKPQYTTNCDKYWVRRLTFDIAYDFDRCIMDEGTKALRGQWDKNPQSATYGQYIVNKKSIFFPIPIEPNSPRNFDKYKDWNGDTTRVILDGFGRPWDAFGDSPDPTDDNPGQICIEYYYSANLFLLGIPAIIDE